MGSESRSRKKSKYLSYPYISYVNKELAGETGKNACSHDSREAVFVRVPVNGFVGSPALVKCTRKKLLRLHPKEFEYPPPDPSRVTPAEFLSDIGLLALDCSYPSGSDKIHAIEWFSYKLWSYLFRDQSSHEAYVKNASDQKEDFHDASYRDGRRRGRKRKSDQAAEVGTNGYPAAGDQTGSWRLPDLNGGQQGMNTPEKKRGRRNSKRREDRGRFGSPAGVHKSEPGDDDEYAGEVGRQTDAGETRRTR